MPFDIRTLSNLERTRANLDELIAACRARGPLYCHDPGLTNDVVRKAKGLRTSLGKLAGAVDDAKHERITEEPPMTTKEPLYLRLWRDPELYELARYISYGGRREKDVKAKVEEMREQYAGNKMMWAMVELTTKDEKSGLTVLKPDVRKLCKGLLGPAPEDDEYDRYWSVNKRTPPPEHQPPAPEVEAQEPPKPAKKRGRARG